MRRISPFLVFGGILGLLIAQFLWFPNLKAASGSQVTVSAVVLEHLTYQKTEKSIIISTNLAEGITYFSPNGDKISGKIIEVPINEVQSEKKLLFVTANF